MKRKKLKPYSLRDVPKLKRKARILVNTFVRKRDGRCRVRYSKYYKPEYGVCKGQLEASHIFSERIAPSLRFDPENIVTKCSYHHKYWWHDNPHEGIVWIQQELGERYTKLKRRAREEFNDFSYPEPLLAVIEKYESK